MKQRFSGLSLFTTFAFKFNRMRVFTLVLFLIGAMHFSGFSQTVEVVKSTRIEKIEGKQYYIHTVIKGQTLYSISKAYNVLISDIVFENQEAIDGIKPGMELKIIVKADKDGPKDKPVEINGKFRVHTVEKGQTLYAVSKLYNVTVEAIKQANPGLTETLSLGQKINIPVEQVVKTEEILPVQDGKETKSDSSAVDRNKINVVMLLPLFLKENAYANDTAGSVNTLYSKSINGIEFYEGARMAIDSLTRTGLKASVYVYDIPDEAALNKILTNPVLKQADIIIGPFYAKKFENLALFAKENKIACVSPVLRKNDIAENNPFVSKVLPSDETQIIQMGDFIGRWNCTKNIIVMHNNSAGDSLLVAQVSQGIKNRCANANMHVLNTKGRGVKLVDSLIQPNIENIIVAFSNDEGYISRLVLHLERKNSKQKIVTLFGLNEWQDFENIEVEYFQNVNLHFPSDLFVDYNRPEVKSFILKFREEYLAEPGKYSFLGYDVTMYYLQILKKYGKEFYKSPPSLHATGLQSNFDFKKINEEGGLENQNTFILNYNEYRLVKVN